MNKRAVLAVIFLITGFIHRIHVSVTELEFDKESKAIEMSIHVFSDDLEKHLRFIEKDDALDIMEVSTEVRDLLLSAYFVENVSLKINGKIYVTHYLGHEVEDYALWVFLEVPNIRNIKVLEIENTVLLDLFDDQANLIHFQYGGDVYSEKLDNTNAVAQYNIADL